MRVGFDSKFLPKDGGEPQFAVVLLHGKNAEDASMRRLVDRWQGHMTSTLFTLPIFNRRLEDAEETEETVLVHSDQLPLELETRACELDKYLDRLRHDYGLENDRIAIVGYAEGATLALYYGLQQDKPMCGIIGFCATFEGFDGIQNELKSRPPVLLVHGADGRCRASERVPDVLSQFVCSKGSGVHLLSAGPGARR